MADMDIQLSDREGVGAFIRSLRKEGCTASEIIFLGPVGLSMSYKNVLLTRFAFFASPHLASPSSINLPPQSVSRWD